MKNISIEYKESGLNSSRLILNSIVDAIEANDPYGAIVYVSPEVSLDDVIQWVKDSLVYKIDASIMHKYNMKNGQTKDFISMFVE